VFTGNGSGLSAIAGGNVTGTVSSATTAGTVTTAAQPNITSVGTLTSLAVTGNVTAGNANVTGQLISTIATGTAPLVVTSTTQVANLSVATAGSATTAGTVTTAAQPNITSVGTLSALSVTGNITAGNISATNHTGTTSNITGQYITTLATGTAPFVVTSTTQVANLSVATAGSATTAGTVTTAAQPNITSVGTLTGLTLSNAAVISVGSNTNVGTFTGNFSLSAGSRLNATYADLAEKYVADSEYTPGTVLVFGGEQEVTLANTFDSTRVAGVVTTNPAYTMNNDCQGEHVVNVALQGRVPVKVTGNVAKGDLMVTGENGRAIANNEARAGTIIGKSLENFTGTEGTIEVAVGRF
jgi:hypothetical protein